MEAAFRQRNTVSFQKVLLRQLPSIGSSFSDQHRKSLNSLQSEADKDYDLS